MRIIFSDFLIWQFVLTNFLVYVQQSQELYIFNSVGIRGISLDSRCRCATAWWDMGVLPCVRHLVCQTMTMSATDQSPPAELKRLLVTAVSVLHVHLN